MKGGICVIGGESRTLSTSVLVEDSKKEGKTELLSMSTPLVFQSMMVDPLCRN